MVRMCFRFWGRKKNNNISLQAIRRWESRTFLGKWWRQQAAVLFILTRPKKRKKKQIQLLQPRWMELHEDGLCITTTPRDCSRLFNLSCPGADVFAVLPELGSQIIISIDSPVIKEGRKKSISGLQINTVTSLNPLKHLLSLKVSIPTADGCSISQAIQSISQHINL